MTAAIALAHVERPEETALDRLDAWQRGRSADGGRRYVQSDPVGPHIQLVAYEMRQCVIGDGLVAVPVPVSWGVGRGTAAALSDLAERGAEMGVW